MRWGEPGLKCSHCGSENPGDKKSCRDCGVSLKSAESPDASWRNRVARQTAYICILISILLIVIAFGIKSQADDVPSYDHSLLHLKHALIDIAWLFGLLALGGLPVAGLAYLFSLPTIVKMNDDVEPDTPAERRDVEGKS